MGTELECKVRLSDREAVIRRLDAGAWARRGEVFERNWLFDRGGELAARGEALRLRTLDGAAGGLVTHKGPAKAGPYKEREETETVADDPEALRRIFAAQGFAPVFYYEKKRITWESGTLEAVVDTLPRLGDFLEIEAPDAASLRRALAELGLGDVPVLKKGYPTLGRDLGLTELRFDGDDR